MFCALFDFFADTLFLYFSDKQLKDYKETFESLGGSNEGLKEKKIVELAKKNRAL